MLSGRFIDFFGEFVEFIFVGEFFSLYLSYERDVNTKKHRCEAR